MTKSNIKAAGHIGRKIASFLANGVLIFFTATCVFPVIWLIYSSFKTNAEFAESIIKLPASLNFDHYLRILNGGDMMKYLVNSLRTTMISLALIVVFGYIIGYFLARYTFKGSKALNILYTLGLLIPIHAIIVPMYIQFNQAGLSDKWYTLIIPYVSFGLPIAVFLVASYVRSIPREMEEAAALDGCSFTRTLFLIIMPMCRPVLTTAAIIQFFTCWNEFIFALILVNEKYMTIPVGMTMFKGQFTAEYPVMMTTMVIGMLPALIIYLAFSKHIIKGMVAGAVKG